jgi:hypothetical protein
MRRRQQVAHIHDYVSCEGHIDLLNPLQRKGVGVVLDLSTFD